MTEQHHHFIIGTAGHIDHGKTALVKALTGIDADRLKEEQERGMTIDLGYAFLDVEGVRVGIVDVPGHERFVKNMLAGATGIDVAMLVVAADDGVMPQTTEHLEILDLLGIKQGFVVITKTDLVDADLLRLVREEVENLLKGTTLEGAEIVCASAVTGRGIEDVRKTIAAVVKGTPARRYAALPFRMPIDRVFSLAGRGCIVTGSLIAGSVRAGDEIEISPPRLDARIRSVQVHGEDVDSAHAGQRVALNLAGVKATQLSRGHVLAPPDHLFPTHLVDCFLRYLASATRPLRHNNRVRFHSGTSEVMGRVSILERDQVKPGDRCYVQVKLERPVVVQARDRFVIRAYSPVRTIGGGEIVRSRTRRLKRLQPGVIAALERLCGGEADAVEQTLLDEEPFRLKREDVVHRAELPLQRLGEIVEDLRKSGRVVEMNAGWLAHQRQIEKILRQVESVLDSFHQRNRTRIGMPAHEVMEKIRTSLTTDSFKFVVERMKQAGTLKEVEGRLALSQFEPALNEREKEIMAELEDIFRKAQLSPPSVEEATGRFPGEQHVAERVLTLLVDMGKIVTVGGGIYLHREVLEELKNRVKGALEKGERMTVADFRDLLNTSRKYLIPILEYLDAVGVTVRQGNSRTLKK